MSFKYDKEHWDLTMARREEFEKAGYTVAADPVEGYLGWMEGMVLCNCGAGCRDTAADNVAKLIALVRGVQSGLSMEALTEIAFKDPEEFERKIHDEAWEEATRRAPKS
jgi:hypothetical protein